MFAAGSGQTTTLCGTVTEGDPGPKDQLATRTAGPGAAHRPGSPRLAEEKYETAGQK